MTTNQTEKPVDERAELPPLPEPAREAEGAGAAWRNAHPDYYTADQMRDYARAALLEAEAQRPALKPLTDEQVTAGARELCRINAGMCGTDFDDEWKTYGEQFKADARACLQAAHGIKEQA